MSSKIKAGTSSSGVVLDADNTGILELQSGSTPTTAVTVNTSQQVGIGTTSPSYRLHVSGNGTGTNSRIGVTNTGTSSTTEFGNDANGGFMATSGAFGNLFYTNDTERMRISSTGQLLIGKSVTTATVAGNLLSGTGNNQFNCNGDWNMELYGTGGYRIRIASSDNVVTQVGSITCTASATTYATSSDYRLKENVSPMTGALAKVSQLKPVTYKWKYDNSDGQGFIAHELQEIFPDAVHGEKDATEIYTDEDGKEQTRIAPQGIDTSFLVATLTAAIQELNAKVDAQALEIKALKGVA